MYSKTCVKRPLSKRPKIGFQDQLSLNAGQKYCRMLKHFRLSLSYHLSLMPRLHLPYDEHMMPVRCPNHRFRAASAGRPGDHRTDLRASWPLRFCLTPHNDKIEKNHKPVARRHIAVTSYDPRTGITR